MVSVYGGSAPSPHRAGECKALAAADGERGSLKVVTNRSVAFRIAPAGMGRPPYPRRTLTHGSARLGDEFSCRCRRRSSNGSDTPLPAPCADTPSPPPCQLPAKAAPPVAHPGIGRRGTPDEGNVGIHTLASITG